MQRPRCWATAVTKAFRSPDLGIRRVALVTVLLVRARAERLWSARATARGPGAEVDATTKTMMRPSRHVG